MSDINTWTLIISLLSALFACISVIVTLFIYRQSRSDTSYLDVDKQYCELLQIGLSDPDLRDYARTSQFYRLGAADTFRKKYNIYAYMCWNLVETIYDKQRDSKGRFRLSETWIPVMFEENRLHYTWFKHNLRLFRPKFQKFVTAELNDIDIIEGTVTDLKEIYARFMNDFQPSELKDLEHLEMLMGKKKYKLLLARHKIFGEIVGYALVFELDSQKALWLDYMAIDPKFQASGYGTLLFNRIAESKHEGIVGMYMELEYPDSADEAVKADQQRRIKFYERLGAKKLGFNYKLPTKKGGFPMMLYFRPTPNVKMLPKEQIQETVAAVYDYIHTDIPDREAMLASFSGDIQDAYFK